MHHEEKSVTQSDAKRAIEKIERRKNPNSESIIVLNVRINKSVVADIVVHPQGERQSNRNYSIEELRREVSTT